MQNIHGCAINCVILSLLIQQLILLFFNTVRASGQESGLLPPRSAINSQSGSSILGQCGSGSGSRSRILFWSNIAIYISQGLHKAYMKDVQASGEAFSSQKRTSSTSKSKTWNFFTFSIFVGYFSLLDPDPAVQNQCGSESEKLLLTLLKKEL